MGLFNLSAIRYIAGTINNVIKNANINPHIIVSESGFQKATLSPPKKICGFKSVNKVTKLILNPTASGINARMAASAVSNTGTILVLPASMTASLVFIPLALSSSANSITRIPFFTTIPDKPTIPIPLVTAANVERKIPYPSNTPIRLNMISESTIIVLLYDPN